MVMPNTTAPAARFSDGSPVDAHAQDADRVARREARDRRRAQRGYYSGPVDSEADEHRHGYFMAASGCI